MRPVLLGEVALELAGDDDRAVGKAGRAPGRELEHEPRPRAPLLAPPIEPLDCDDRRRARELREQAERARPGRVEVDQVVVATSQSVGQRDHAVARRLEVLGVHLRQADHADAAMLTNVGIRVGATRIDGHVMTALDEMRGQLLHRAFHAAVCGRYPAKSDHGDPKPLGRAGRAGPLRYGVRHRSSDRALS